MRAKNGIIARQLTELCSLHGLPQGKEFLDNGVARRLYERTLEIAGNGPFAVFAYGSLMWAPEFAPAFELKARIHGYRRMPCILSTHYRGTPKKPGLVFGLDSGGSCVGFLLGIPKAKRRALIHKLFVREMFQGVYYPHICKAHVIGRQSETIRCLAFVANHKSPSYAAPMDPSRLQRMVYAARGTRGPCIEYWRQSCSLLSSHGIDWDPGFPLDDK